MQNWLGKQLHLLAKPTVTQTHTGMCVFECKAVKSARPLFTPTLRPITCHPSGVTLIRVDFIGELSWLHTDTHTQTHSYVQTHTHKLSTTLTKRTKFSQYSKPWKPDDPTQTLDFDRCVCLSVCVCARACVCVCVFVWVFQVRRWDPMWLKAAHEGGLIPRSSISLSAVTTHTYTHTHKDKYAHTN